jgi:hypothetical protein
VRAAIDILRLVFGRRPGRRLDEVGAVDRARRVLGVNFLDDLLDARLCRDRFVEDELDFGHAPQRQPLGQQVADEAGGAFERLGGLLALGGVADDGPVNTRQRQVAGHLGAGDGDEPDAGVPHFRGQHLAHFLADLLLDALDAMGQRQVTPPAPRAPCGTLR